MRHFIGGWALGFVFLFWRLPMKEGDIKPFLFGCLLLSFPFGLAAWGLWP